MAFTHRRIDQDIDISTLRQMRYEGMTNKQIASAVGCSTSSVYRLIGKKSADVQHAAEQNKPSPVRNESAPVSRAKDDVPQTMEPLFVGEPAPVRQQTEPVVTEEKSVKSTLRVLREVRILDLEGELCTYHIDPRSGDVEFGGDIIKGLLDRHSLAAFISELTEVQQILNEN